MAEDRGVSWYLGALASMVDLKICLLKDVVAEYREIKTVIDEVTEEKGRLQQEEERLQHERHANGEALAAMKEDLVASKNILVSARDALMASTEEISRKNNELEVLKIKLQESEAKNNQAAQQLEVLKIKLQESEAKNNQAVQQCGSATETMQPRGVQTRSMDKRKRPSERSLGYGAYENEYTSQLDDQSPSRMESMGNLNVQTRSVRKQKRPTEGNDAANLELIEGYRRQELVNNPTVDQTSSVLVSRDDELEAVREALIKGFLKFDFGGRKLGIKEMGELNEKAFNDACLRKLPPEEVGAAFYKLYSSWQQQLSDLSWYPFKTVAVDGTYQEIVNVDDDKLQELKGAWGEGAHNAVVNALKEMKEYGRLSDRTIAYELWNFSEGRKATTKECVEYMCSQVKQLSVAKRRKTRRW